MINLLRLHNHSIYKLNKVRLKHMVNHNRGCIKCGSVPYLGHDRRPDKRVGARDNTGRVRIRVPHDPDLRVRGPHGLNPDPRVGRKAARVPSPE
jgi:hypothetical protein